MRFLQPFGFATLLLAACGNQGQSAHGAGGTTSSTGSASTGATASNGTSMSTTSGVGGGNGTWQAGNPNGSCSAVLPAGAQPANTSQPTTVVGTGSPASCTFDALKAAVAKGGVITFDCGSGPATVKITATLQIPNDRNTVIDGGKKVTLDGGNAVQIMSWAQIDWMKNENRLTLQHIALVNGKTTPTKAIPTAPPPCSQGWDDGEGGALKMTDGNLTVIDSIFTNDQAAPLGPDTGGGAIYINGSKHGAIIVGSTFTGNKGSNAGAVGGLFAELDIYNSLFTGNTAIGNGANNDDATKCSVINNGQHEVGSGGNGGAVYQDGGAGTNIVLCGDEITSNVAGTGAFGGGVFMTSNDWSGSISISDTKITGNTGGHWSHLQQGSVMDLGTAFGINAKSATVQNSTLQGI